VKFQALRCTCAQFVKVTIEKYPVDTPSGQEAEQQSQQKTKDSRIERPFKYQPYRIGGMSQAGPLSWIALQVPQ
jgi:hypothetical protein